MSDVIHVQAKLTETRHKSLRAKAKKAGMTLTEFISAMIDNREVVPAKVDLRKDVRELSGWCARLNSNLNMIAKHCNVYKAESETLLIMSQLHSIRDEVLGLARLANALDARRQQASGEVDPQ
ncbi:plasmid mobilization protein [Pseudomonas aeruginosa]